MNLLEVGQSGKADYNRFIEGSETGSFLQSWDWGDWQKRLGRTVYRFKIQDLRGGITGAVQLVKIPLPWNKYYLYAPYGPVIDSRFRPEDFKDLTQEVKNKFPDALFLRLEPKAVFNFQLSTFNLPMVKSANIQPGKTLVMDLSLPETALLSAMHPKTRYNIRLAHKHGVVVEKDLVITPGHGLYFQEAVELIVATAVRQGYKGHAKKYYENLVDFFAKRDAGQSGVAISIYKALYHNQLLASAIIVDFGSTRTYLFGGSSESDKQIMAPYALHWQAMLDAKAAGLKTYDFWGLETASGKTQGFARFKQGFGGKAVEYPGAHDLPFSKAGYAAYRLTRSLLKRLGR